nr:preprotein translocase subunit YajC [Streptomyces boncukensis]
MLPFIVLIGAMFLMTRSAKKKQRQASEMRDAMQPGTGVRTIGGMYAVVKEIRDDAVLLELEPGVHGLFAKNAIGAVLPDDEFDRIVSGQEAEPLDVDVPDDASALTSDEDEAPADGKPDLTKKGDAEEDAEEGSEARTVQADADSKDAERDGDQGSK